ncbi:hypothetical protein OO013_19960 [Mangrovivirga sp. M17]|uniref:Lipoprotein n=1 Tax=Mangrovivirga halotolerans TaxID=2993936 RepID=A0ABT3RWL0_9BACT|nr:hypothetical protein [Mangrovivirga halotolerans]MCX2746165.1 hypothetical protein [Mangrovivirga halotolerans]
MRNSITYLIILTLLISCNQEKRLLEYSQEKADKFVEMYSDEFLKDTELLRYSYHPRAQFTFGQDSSNNYRIFPRETEIRMICFSDSCELTESFNDTPLKLSEGSYTLKQDSIFTDLSYDSTTFKIHQFKQNPEDYFNGLKKRLEKYGVFAYSESKDKSFVKVYLSVQYYLVNSKDVENDINEDEILKSYNDNWYFVKMKRQMDLG